MKKVSSLYKEQNQIGCNSSLNLQLATTSCNPSNVVICLNLSISSTQELQPKLFLASAHSGKCTLLILLKAITLVVKKRFLKVRIICDTYRESLLL